jgi:hypothetical protein
MNARLLLSIYDIGVLKRYRKSTDNFINNICFNFISNYSKYNITHKYELQFSVLGGSVTEPGPVDRHLKNAKKNFIVQI